MRCEERDLWDWGVRIFVDYTQAKALERVLLTVWQACRSAKKFCPVEGTWYSLMEFWGQSPSIRH